MKKSVIVTLLIGLLIGCKSPEARQPISEKSGSFIKASAERNLKLFQKEQGLIESIISNHPDIDYKTSESGFWYYYNTQIEQDSLTAGFGDIVNFNYDVKDLNGNVIYSIDEIPTQNYSMDQEELFTGLREGLKLMKAGETVTFLFPSQKAFGYYGDTKKIGTNVPLICQVTVNSITQKNK